MGHVVAQLAVIWVAVSVPFALVLGRLMTAAHAVAPVRESTQTVAVA
jgi:hypothetical protein